MDENIINFKSFLSKKFPRLIDIIKSFKECSLNDNDNEYLVESKVTTINFDKLTEWYINKQGVKSADSMSLSNDSVYLIEFKSGDLTTNEKKFQKLTSNVIGKINDSDKTLNKLYNEAKIDKINQVFCLVVDTKKMGISALTTSLISRSLIDNKNDKEIKILEQLKPNLNAGVLNPDHFSNIEIWYSQILDTHLSKNGITDFCIE